MEPGAPTTLPTGARAETRLGQDADVAHCRAKESVSPCASGLAGNPLSCLVRGAAHSGRHTSVLEEKPRAGCPGGCRKGVRARCTCRRAAREGLPGKAESEQTRKKGGRTVQVREEEPSEQSKGRWRRPRGRSLVIHSRTRRQPRAGGRGKGGRRSVQRAVRAEDRRP